MEPQEILNATKVLSATKETLYEPMSDGTTILSLVYDSGVLIAGDTRSSSGSFVGNKVSDKLEPLHQ